jgi:hypothetical protein
VIRVSPTTVLGLVALAAFWCGSFAALGQGTTQRLPVFTEQPPEFISASNGAVLRLQVSVADPATTRLQWRRNGGNIPGETSPTLTLSNIQPSDGGLYHVVAYNEVGAVNSDPTDIEFSNLPFPNFGDTFGSGPLLGSGFVRGTTIDATAQPGEPRHAGHPPRHSVWARWVAPKDGVVTFRTAGSRIDTVLAAYTGTSISQLVPVASDDDSGEYLSSRITFRARAQTTYHIAVDSFGGRPGKFVLFTSFEETPVILPTINTEPVDRTVAPGTDVTFSVEADSSNYGYQWFFNGQVVGTSPTLAIKSAGPEHVGEYFCRIFNGTSRFRDTRRARLQLNINEFGQADPKLRSSEKLNRDFVGADDFRKLAGAAPKSVAHGYSGTQVFSTVGATKEYGEPNHCGVAGGASEWFAFQAATNGTIYLDTDGSTFDTVLAVYTGPGDSFATLVPVACDNNSGLDGKDSRVSFAATQGTIYWVAVDGVNHPSSGAPAKGTVQLHYRLVLPLKLSAVAYTNASGGRLTFRISGTPNLAASVELCTNLNVNGWLPLMTNSAASGTFFYTNSGASGAAHRMFRAVNRF